MARVCNSTPSSARLSAWSLCCLCVVVEMPCSMSSVVAWPLTLETSTACLPFSCTILQKMAQRSPSVDSCQCLGGRQSGSLMIWVAWSTKAFESEPMCTGPGPAMAIMPAMSSVLVELMHGPRVRPLSAIVLVVTLMWQWSFSLFVILPSLKSRSGHQTPNPPRL